MTKTEWQIKYGLSDAEMTQLEENILRIFNGKIVAVKDNPKREILRV